jgi:hypothetical protein
MDIEFISAAFGILAGVSTASIGYGAARTRINRSDKDIISLRDEFGVHIKDDVNMHSNMVQRLSRIEALLEQINKRV